MSNKRYLLLIAVLVLISFGWWYSSRSVLRQLMIKFKPNTFECSSDGIAKLSLDARIHVEFMRNSGETYCLVQASNLKVLRRHPAIEWIEEDRKQTTQ